MTDVVVVGGGLAGLVTARRLLKSGLRVTVVEASDRLGGNISRHVVGGITLDAGAESFATRGGTVQALLGEIGLGGEIVSPNPAGAWLQPTSGPAVPLPATSLLGIPGVPAAADVITVIGTRAALRAYLGDTLLPTRVGAKSETLGQLVRARMGDAMVDKLVAPVVQGVHSASPDDLALDRVAPQLRAALHRERTLAGAVRTIRAAAPAGSAVLGIRGGLVRIVDELVADVTHLGAEIRLNSRATAVAPGEVRVGGDTLRGAVVVATSGLLVGDRQPPRTVTLATLVLDSPALDAAPRGTGVLVAEGAAGIRAKALTHATAKWEWLAERAGGKHVVRLSYASDHQGLAEIAREDAAALLGVPLEPSAVLDFARVQWSRAAVSEVVPEGIVVVGEAIAGTGLANIIGHSEAQAKALLSNHAG
ncbi:oxygen-dependent protoporphyrinogen oxidase [Conyzicola lurida]|uniref:Oxygen-dependent protoporphyrinogen oxidase n=1 Tax=Conyzicola lurida TaxID=1172621 RepID=A0A841AT88_9MICO|nr:FAD-dependent oxidoreductase [Conyzicola lurida]MBB5844863.1 oxygen-dependent protoporphyrinogen oxidase [Conyzicola lurida]